MLSATLQGSLSAAFHSFIDRYEATLSAAAFLRWLQSNEPDLCDQVTPEQVLAYAAEYFGTPLRSKATAPPLSRSPNISRAYRGQDK